MVQSQHQGPQRQTRTCTKPVWQQWVRQSSVHPLWQGPRQLGGASGWKHKVLLYAHKVQKVAVLSAATETKAHSSISQCLQNHRLEGSMLLTKICCGKTRSCLGFSIQAGKHETHGRGKAELWLMTWSEMIVGEFPDARKVMDLHTRRRQNKCLNHSSFTLPETP